MQPNARAIAVHPSRFGRGPAWAIAVPAPSTNSISADLKLFATTFLAGFVFVSILIG